MIVSRGWQNASKAAMKGDQASHIHANCDCTYAIRFDGETEYSGYDPDEYLEMYENAEGSTANEKINSMRRSIRRAIDAKKGLNNQASGSMIEYMTDVTAKFENNLKIPFRVETNPEKVILDGIEYTIDGHSIKFDYTDKELQAAQMVSSCLNKKATMMPKFAGKIKNISSPDFMVEGSKWDFKELKGESADAIRNAISKKKKQANNFVININEYGLGEEEAIKQAEHVFEAYNTKFTETLILTKDSKIIRAYIRK